MAPNIAMEWDSKNPTPTIDIESVITRAKVLFKTYQVKEIA